MGSVNNFFEYGGKTKRFHVEAYGEIKAIQLENYQQPDWFIATRKKELPQTAKFAMQLRAPPPKKKPQK